MKNSDLLLAANTLWVARRGGTHGSPASPLLRHSGRTTRDEAAAGKARLRRPFTPHRDANEAAA